MKRVLVTGGNGFIGRQTIPLLLAAGYEVHIASRSGDMMPGATEHSIDLLRHDEVSRIVADIKPTHVLHFAWIATPGVYQESPDNALWRDASLHLFKECIANGTKRIVGAGSCFEYDWSEGKCVENKTPTNAITMYGRCKNECREQLEKLDVSSAWGRIFFLYGPHESKKRLISSVILSLLHSQPALCTHGKQIRDFIYVKDIAAAFVALLESDVKGPVNIATGTSTTVGDLVQLVGKILGKEELIKIGAREAPANEPVEISADVTRLTQELGFTPKYTHERALKETIEWWKESL